MQRLIRSRWLGRATAVACTMGLACTVAFAGNQGDSSPNQELPYAVYLPLVAKPYVPLFVGLQLRWDSNGYIRGSEYYDIGHHLERDLNGMTDADTIRSHNYSWYDPNPFGWSSATWQSYYSVSTGYFKSSSLPPDPSWKWGSPWILPYDWHFYDGQTGTIGARAFNVSGPHSGYTAWGQAVQYWELVNTGKFLYWDSGGDWTQYVGPGDVTLRYDAGASRLMLYRDVLRTYHYQGTPTIDTVQYIQLLTYASSFPANTATDQGPQVHSAPRSGFGWADYTDAYERGLLPSLREER